MRIKLEAEFELNKPLPVKAKTDLKKFLDKANKETLKIGAKEKAKAANIDSWKIKKDKILLQISSGGQVRAHDAVLRLRRPLAELLGKTYKVGIKETKIKNTRIELELEQAPKEKITLPFVKKIELKGKKATLLLEELGDLALERNYPTKIINRFLAKVAMQYGPTGKASTERLIKESPKRLNKYLCQKDPTQEIIDKGWVREFPGAGVWTVMPPLAALTRAIYNLVIDRIAKPLEFTEVLLPRLIPLEIEKKKGHLAIPHEQFWVCPPAKRDPKFFEDYVDYVEITGETASELLMKHLRSPLFGLAYAQCEPFYDFFSKETLDVKKLPFKFYDANGPTWRWEGGGLKGLERLNEFLRVEFVYAGTKDQVIKIRDAILKKAEEIIGKIFDVEYTVTANIPVYLEHAGKVEEKEADFVKTYDLTAKLPFKTVSREEASLEIASFHAHTDFYMQRFHAKEKSGKELWTGCVGIGPSRWAFTFLTRWGFDYKKWPKEIKKYIGKELPKVPEMITWPKLKEKKK